jgi:predicted O-methyltransferase YrrM
MIQISDFLYVPIQETHEQIRNALENSQPESGLIAEFGVFGGNSITMLARAFPKCIIHGFDSFRGLPDKWERGLDTFQPGHFNMDGNMPAVPSNVRLYPGWFKDTIPPFLDAHPGPFRFLNIDCDIYSSAKDVLTLCNSRIKPGTVIYFDEICDWGGGELRYPGWPKHEIKALVEWCTEFKRDVKAYSRNGRYGAAVVVTQQDIP